MVTLQNCLRPNAEVAAKVIDGEAILINLANGVYYSMDGVGAHIWELLDAGHRLDAIVMAIGAAYDVSPEQAQSDVERLVAELYQEQLVTKSDAQPVAMDNQASPPQTLVYEPPVLNIYRDMADLLALDPPTPGLQDIAWKEPDYESPH